MFKKIRSSMKLLLFSISLSFCICIFGTDSKPILRMGNSNAASFGLALVIVKAKKGERGRIIIKAESNGLKYGSIEIMSK